MAYEHPGLAYVSRCGEPADEAGILRYADFLRQEAGLSPGPLASLEAIYQRFGMQRPDLARLPVRRGFVLNSDTGHIVIAEDDPASVQRFTEGHELFELLFAVLPPDTPSILRLFARKESLCDMGSAYLLMDAASYSARIRQLGVSLGSVRQLAVEYRVSLTAALRRVVELAPGRHVMVVWYFGYAPDHSYRESTEHRTVISERRTRRLRIAWAWDSDGTYVPRDQVVPEDTSIYRAYELGLMTAGRDQLGLVGLSGVCLCENKPFRASPERKVMSLIHLPGDIGCESAIPNQEIGG
jgi:hypothetical protein